VFAGDVICFTIFSWNSSEKRDFQIYYTNYRCSPSNIYCHILHATSNFTVIYCIPRFFGSFIAKFEIWIQDSGTAGHVSSATYFENRRFKIKLTLSMILRVNLKLGGYSIWNTSLIAPHIKKTRQLFGV
jgi:hypothetical protein